MWGDVPRGVGASHIAQLAALALWPAPKAGCCCVPRGWREPGSPAVLCLQQKGFLLAFLLPAKCQEGLGLIAAYVYKNI